MHEPPIDWCQAVLGGLPRSPGGLPGDEPCRDTSLRVGSLGSTAPEAPPKLDLLQTSPYWPVPRRSQAFHSAGKTLSVHLPRCALGWGRSQRVLPPQSSAVRVKNDPWCEENSKHFPGRSSRSSRGSPGCRCCLWLRIHTQGRNSQPSALHHLLPSSSAAQQHSSAVWDTAMN